MSEPVIQRLFDTPLIEAHVELATVEGAVAAALMLAERNTVDVSQPTQPRFAWAVQVSEVALASGEAQSLAASPGDLWLALIRIDTVDEPAHVTIEDSRAGVLLAGPAGLMHGGDPVIETVAVAAGGLVMFPAYLRHSLRNDARSPQRWARVQLRPRRLHP